MTSENKNLYHTVDAMRCRQVHYFLREDIGVKQCPYSYVFYMSYTIMIMLLLSTSCTLRIDVIEFLGVIYINKL
jgi:hypothetical protein